jgi:uncharacterized Ntn-hydrolase superfamily protein
MHSMHLSAHRVYPLRIVDTSSTADFGVSGRIRTSAIGRFLPYVKGRFGSISDQAT